MARRRGVLFVLAAALLIVLCAVLALLLRAGPPRRREGGAATRREGGAATRREKRALRAAGPRVSVRWDGPRACFPPAMIAEGRRAARALPGYGPVTEAERGRLAEEAARLSRKYGRPLSTEALVSLRRMEVALAARRRGMSAARYGRALAAARAGGAAVLELAARYDLPPVAVLRELLAAAGLSPGQVRAAVADPALLPPAFAREAPAVYAADEGSRQNAARVQAAAQEYEDAVGAHLRALGLDFETEADLRARGPAPDGAPLLTPDYLLREVVLVDGRPVRWLDAKNYPCTDSPLVAAGLRKQVAKYTARFGPGALIFGGGVMCESATARLGALVLDGSHVPRPRKRDGASAPAPGERPQKGGVAT